jgi:hypothetical protein
MEGLLTHVATADCFITPPHPALDCGIVTAWWHYQVKGTRAHRGSMRMSNASGYQVPLQRSDQTRRALET